MHVLGERCPKNTRTERVASIGWCLSHSDQCTNGNSGASEVGAVATSGVAVRKGKGRAWETTEFILDLFFRRLVGGECLCDE